MSGAPRPHGARASVPAMVERLAAVDWPRFAADLDAHGCAVIPGVLSPQECAALAQSYTADEWFRRRIVMERHGFGAASINTSLTRCQP